MNKKLKFLVTAGLIAALYTALTYLSAALGLAYGQIQVRLSEALCVLAAFTPAAIPGLTVGCFIGNLGSTLGVLDWVVGTAATLISALLGRALRNVRFKGLPLLTPLPCVAVNMVMVGAELAMLLAPSGTFWAAFWINALTVGAGQLIACYVIGLPLFAVIDRSPLGKILSDSDKNNEHNIKR